MQVLYPVEFKIGKVGFRGGWNTRLTVKIPWGEKREQMTISTQK